MAKCNGHRSWNAFNVNFWFIKDKALYARAREYAQKSGIDRGARRLAREIGGSRTPDGAVYNYTCIREAMRGILD